MNKVEFAVYHDILHVCMCVCVYIYDDIPSRFFSSTFLDLIFKKIKFFILLTSHITPPVTTFLYPLFFFFL